MKILPLFALALLATPAFADDVNVKTQTLPNETTYVAPPVVDVVCVVDDSALLKDCKLADEAKVADAATLEAIKTIVGKWHMTGHYTAGQTTQIKLMLNNGHRSTPWRLIR